ncbi:hypothetical protein NEOLEDRAFT_1071260 [Neolentinus lepideus HHB14362 ss-1]|uniref:FAD binding domain-containing protein n=1 Tax=Neolentinus lepideus HHB14362 ss-1 TaxID=1314782 RepID=A0A165QLG7_9AGAM|nr:hypothetical protein NEOLEDRAFT_1071260 [Neolentinus lepideus HHB14362 ss-1]
MKESYTDVLVIGAGPAGLMCAQALARAGVKVKIIDKRPNKVSVGHADGIQPRTIEVFNSYGMGERMLREGIQVHMAAFYNPGPSGGIERSGRAPDVNAPTARYPFEMTVHQGALETMFLDAMHSMDVRVQRSIAPISVNISEDKLVVKDPQAYAVTTVLQHQATSTTPNDQETVHAKYVLGSDGAHSWTRTTFGITMEGDQTNYVWGVLDMVPETDFPDIRNRTAIHSHNGSCMVIPRERDIIRIYIQLTEEDIKRVTNPETGRPEMKFCSPEILLDVANRSFKPYYIKPAGEIEWWTLYIIGQRVASKFAVDERVFIAGDACHTHSPKAGQGMNASMQDTHNLAWKIAHVLRGWADMSLLKTYEIERRKFAQDLINFDRKFATLFSGKPRTGDSDDGVSHEEFVQAWKTFGNFSSGIGVHYPESPVVNVIHQGTARNLIIGQRMVPQTVIRAADAWPFDIQDMLPADTRFKVVVFLGDLSEDVQREKVNILAQELEKSDSFLKTYPPPGVAIDAVFDIISIMAGKKVDVDFTDVPELIRPHWSKVFVDDVDFSGRMGGKAYSTYGIDSHGAVVIVRPDQFVGMIAPLNKVNHLNQYFASFRIGAAH